MKLPFLMCVFFATSVSAEVWSQQRLTMRLGETGLKEVFKEIQRQTNKAVVYNDDQLTLSKKVKANFTDVELEEILKQVLQGQGMSYKFMDDIYYTGKTASNTAACRRSNGKRQGD